MQPPSQTAFLRTDRELVKMKHQSAGEREEENDGHRFWETIFTLCFGFFGREACGILALQPGTEPTLPALEGEVLTTGQPGKSPKCVF